MAQAHWSRRPPVGTDIPPATPIWRVKPGKHLSGVILSDDITGHDLHWLNNRSVPHVKPTAEEEAAHLTSAELCEGCIKKRPIYWEAYAVVWHPTLNSIAVIPVSIGNVEVVEAYIAQHETLRGAQALLSRPGLSAKSRVVLTLTRSEVPAAHLPACPDLQRILRHVWGLDVTTDADFVREINEHVVPFGVNGSNASAPVCAHGADVVESVSNRIARHAHAGNGKAV